MDWALLCFGFLRQKPLRHRCTWNCSYVKLKYAIPSLWVNIEYRVTEYWYFVECWYVYTIIMLIVRWRPDSSQLHVSTEHCQNNKKFRYCLETARRERLAEIADLCSFWETGCENDNLVWNDLQMSFKVIQSGANRKLVYELLLVVYSNFLRITHRFRDRLQAVLMLKTTFCLPVYHTCIWPWIWRPCHWMETKFGARKLISCGCHMVKKSWS